MKRILLLLIIIGVSHQLKAQQTLKPTDSLFFRAPKELKSFKLNDSTLFKNFSPLMKSNQLASIPNLGDDSEFFNSRMPVVKVDAVEKMPVAKLGDNENNHYTMLVKKVKVVDPLATAKVFTP